MGMKMLCPYCREEGKTPPTVYSLKQARSHLEEEHDLPEEEIEKQMERGKKNWQAERAAWRHERIAYEWSQV